MSDYLKLVYRRALTQRDPSLLQVAFDVAVLERYRGDAAYSIIRTNTVGRVKKQGGWTLDFGIAPGDAAIHASWGSIAQALPDEELPHWASHANSLMVSEMFLKMQLSPGACHDDGEVRTW
ncbi:MAG: hypothetical protein M3P30_11990 [Chloroflexota bacterium]|nr:hypothetical protein [Chloroflexota bacterium]